MVEIGAQRIGGESLFPATRRQGFDLTRRMQGDALQYVDQVGVGIDLVQPAGRQQALDDTDMPGTDLAPAKQPVLAPHRDDPQGSLQMIGVDRYIRITQVDP